MNGTKSKIGMILLSLTLSWSAHAVRSGERLNVTPTRGLHLRADVGRSSRSLDILRRGDAVVATGRTRAGWIEVDRDGRRGWVKGDYVTEAGFCARCQTADASGNPLINAGRAIVRTVKDAVLRYADRLAQAFHVGYRVRRSACWRAVWEVLKRANLVSGDLTQRYAKDALKDLRRFGFHHDPRACKTPGVVRVYDRARPGHGIGSEGDYAGHIEIMGKDRRFHHFSATPRPMNERVGEANRPLKYCLVK